MFFRRETPLQYDNNNNNMLVSRYNIIIIIIITLHIIATPIARIWS